MGGLSRGCNIFKLKSQWVVITMSGVLKLMSKIFVLFFFSWGREVVGWGVQGKYVVA